MGVADDEMFLFTIYKARLHTLKIRRGCITLFINEIFFKVRISQHASLGKVSGKAYSVEIVKYTDDTQFT